MFRYWIVVCSIVAGIVLWTGQASAGWIIEQVVKGEGEGGRQQVVLQANRMKTLMVDANGQPSAAFSSSSVYFSTS